LEVLRASKLWRRMDEEDRAEANALSDDELWDVMVRLGLPSKEEDARIVRRQHEAAKLRHERAIAALAILDRSGPATVVRGAARGGSRGVVRAGKSTPFEPEPHAVVRVTKIDLQPGDDPEDRVADYDYEGFQGWVWEVLLAGYKRNLPIPEMDEAIQIASDNGFEVEVIHG